MATVDSVFQSKGLWEWYKQNGSKGTNVFDGVSEKGIDYADNFGTPIGAIASGQVVSVQPHTNSIGDVVMVYGPTGLWLYQHITSKVKVGDTVKVGDVVGTENGLPVDQYSTGPHIEVRYSPTYLKGVDSWFQPWVNPFGVFSTIGSKNVDDTSVSTSKAIVTMANAGNTQATGGGGPLADLQSTIDSTAKRAGILAIALVLLIFGLYMMFQKQIDSAAVGAAKVAVLA